MANIVWNHSFDDEVGNNLLFEFAVAFEGDLSQVYSLNPTTVPFWLFLSFSHGIERVWYPG